MSFKLKIMTAQGTILEEEVESMTAPGIDGYYGVLSQHAPMVSAIGTGVLKVVSAGNISYFAIIGGIAEISREVTTVLADIIKKVAGPDEAAIEIEEMTSPTPTGH